ncbi:MAG: hypothetical protein ABIP38_04750, partial [Steroidobacteraceae bacterium]
MRNRHWIFLPLAVGAVFVAGCSKQPPAAPATVAATPPGISSADIAAIRSQMHALVDRKEA